PAFGHYQFSFAIYSWRLTNHEDCVALVHKGKGDRHDTLVLVRTRPETFDNRQRRVHADYWNVAEPHHAGGGFVHRSKVPLTFLKRVCRVWPGNSNQHWVIHGRLRRHSLSHLTAESTRRRDAIQPSPHL